MKLVAPLLLASFAAASPWFGVDQNVLDGDTDLSVPGDNPLLYCEKPDNWQLEITSADIDPNPPVAGKELAIAATGKLLEDVEEGAVVHISVSYGYIKILTKTLDLCEYSEQVNLTCPMKKGPLKLAKTVELPKEIPPGKYTVVADVQSKDSDTITCLKATVVFGGK